MSTSLIRSRLMVTQAIDRHRWNEVADGAVLQEDGTIIETGTYQELSRKHPNVAVVGSVMLEDRTEKWEDEKPTSTHSTKHASNGQTRHLRSVSRC